jgi:hypothetical protein
MNVSQIYHEGLKVLRREEASRKDYELLKKFYRMASEELLIEQGIIDNKIEANIRNQAKQEMDWMFNRKIIGLLRHLETSTENDSFIMGARWAIEKLIDSFESLKVDKAS